MSLANWKDILDICMDHSIVSNERKIKKKSIRLQRRVQLENGVAEEFPVKPEIDRMAISQ